MASITLDPATVTVGSVPRPKYFNRPKNQYKDNASTLTEYERQKLLDKSSTVYVGNLSFYTSESQLYELFSKCGDIKRVIMGLDAFKKTPCGFCFVEYEDRESAEKCINFLDHTQLDGRQLSIDIDTGFVDGRQYGRGKGGGQIRDERKRENPDGTMRTGGGGGPSKLAFFTVSLIMILSILICYPTTTQSGPATILRRYHNSSNSYSSYRDLSSPTTHHRRYPIHASPQGIAFEQTFARLLVDIMKTAKPSLMQAFMKATLDDPKLKEIALGIFFNATSDD